MIRPNTNAYINVHIFVTEGILKKYVQKWFIFCISGTKYPNIFLGLCCQSIRWTGSMCHWNWTKPEIETRTVSELCNTIKKDMNNFQYYKYGSVTRWGMCVPYVTHSYTPTTLVLSMKSGVTPSSYLHWAHRRLAATPAFQIIWSQ